MKGTGGSWDPVWEEVFRSQEWGKYPPECLIRFIAGNFYEMDRPGTRLLEVGCGPGANVWYMSREGFDVYGIDGSPAAIGIAQQRLAAENLKADLKVGDVVQMPYPTEFFDAVIDVECLYTNSLQKSACILGEIKRVLKPGGMFFSKTFTDKMYVGEHFTRIRDLEFKSITDGPLRGKGLCRLSTKTSICELYGRFLVVLSLDNTEETVNNGEMLISEWIVVCRK